MSPVGLNVNSQKQIYLTQNFLAVLFFENFKNNFQKYSNILFEYFPEKKELFERYFPFFFSYIFGSILHIYKSCDIFFENTHTCTYAANSEKPKKNDIIHKNDRFL